MIGLARTAFALVGWQGAAIAGFALLAALGGTFAYGYHEGRSGKAAAVEAAELRIINDLNELGMEHAAAAVAARRGAELEFDRGDGVPTADPHCRDC